MPAHVSHLECAHCGRRHEAGRLATLCGCGGPLAVRYDLARLADRLGGGWPVSSEGAGLWRWAPLLPLADPAHRVTLGEGGTPLLPLPRIGAELGLPRLLAKWEGANPTGTFKDRGMTVAVSMARELGVKRLVVPTAGNAGAAAAAYAARAGLPLTVFAPEATPAANLLEARSYGARVVTTPGTIADAGKLAAAEAEKGAFNLATFREPYRLEGKKTMTLEIVEALGGPPDAVVYPTGGGTGLVGVDKALAELAGLGLVRAPATRLYAVQSEGCAPVVEAFRRGAEDVTAPASPETVASGLLVPKPLAGRWVLRLLRSSRGGAVAVADADIRREALHLAAREGLLVSPESAAAVAGLRRLVADGAVDRAERVVVFLTGSGLKYPHLFAPPASR